MDENEKRDRLINMFKEHKPHGFEIIEGDSRYVILPSIDQGLYGSYTFYKQKDGSWRSDTLGRYWITEKDACKAFSDRFRNHSFEEVQEHLNKQNLSLGELLDSLK